MDNLNTYTTKSPYSTETEKPKPHHEVGERELAQIVKDPDAHFNDRIIVTANVTQFDSATGPDEFRADVAAWDTTEYGFFTGENSFFYGDESDLKKLVQGDTIRAKVTVDGAYEYDTQIGGSTSVPLFMVDSFEIIGSTD
jgi:hypothetical protein